MASSSSSRRTPTMTSSTAAASRALSKANEDETPSTLQKKSQKNFEQLRRLILGRNPSLAEIQALVGRDPCCLQQCDSHHGLYPLHWACVFQCPIECIRYLVEAYPDALEKADSDGRTPLHHACRPEGRVDLVEYLLEQNPGVITQRDHRGKTPLHCACTELVPPEIVRLLVDANPSGAKIRTRDGQTPLHCACEFHASKATIHILVDAYPEAVKFLSLDAMKRGNAKNQDVMSAKIEQAKDYLAWKVQQTEEEADRQAAQELQIEQNQQGERSFSIKNNRNMARYESHQYGRDDGSLSEKDRPVKHRTEQEDLDQFTKQKTKEALRRLQQDEMEVEQKAAELDRLIKQKAALVDTERFQKETERLLDNNKRSNNHRLLNDSGIGRNRSFDDDGKQNNTFLHTNRSPSPAAPRPEVQMHSQTFLTQPPHQQQTSILSSIGGASPKSHVINETESDELFDSLRNSTNTKEFTQKLYPESKLEADAVPWMKQKHPRDPSVASNLNGDRKDVPVGNNVLEEDDSAMLGQEFSALDNGALQEQLKVALKLLQESDERRQQEMREAKQQQASLQAELGKLMDKLERDKPVSKPKEAKQLSTVTGTNRQRQYNNAPGPSGSLGISETVDSTDPSSQMRSQSVPFSTRARQPPQPGAQNLPSDDASNTTSLRPDIKDKHGMTPLHIACANGASYTVVQYLLQQFPMAIYQADQAGNTPLHHACACSETVWEVLQLLLDIFPAATLINNEANQAPLHLACQVHCKRLEVIQLILDTGRSLEQDFGDAVAEEIENDADAQTTPRFRSHS